MKIFAKTDFWLGITILAGGIWTYSQARGFDETSKTYPLFLSVVTILLGIGIAIQAFQQKDDYKASVKWLYDRMKGSLLIVALFIGWTLLLTTKTGYLMSGVLTLLPVLWMLGYRKVSSLVLTSLGIVVAVFALFFIVFEVPLPLNPLVQDVFSLLN